MRINDSKAIRKVVIHNEDGTTEEIEKAMLSMYHDTDDIGMDLRFVNLSKQEINYILHMLISAFNN